MQIGQRKPHFPMANNYSSMSFLLYFKGNTMFSHGNLSVPIKTNQSHNKTPWKVPPSLVTPGYEQFFHLPIQISILPRTKRH